MQGVPATCSLVVLVGQRRLRIRQNMSGTTDCTLRTTLQIKNCRICKNGSEVTIDAHAWAQSYSPILTFELLPCAAVASSYSAYFVKGYAFQGNETTYY